MKPTLKPTFFTFASVLTIFTFLFLMSSCNNEDVYVEQATLLEEELEEELPEDEGDDPVIEFVLNLQNDEYTTLEDTAVTLEPHLNDGEIPEGVIFSFTDPVNGALTINDSIQYTPNDGFFGVDSFEYTGCEPVTGEPCFTAIVTITVEENIDTTTDDDEFLGETRAFPGAQGGGAFAYNNAANYTIREVTSLEGTGPGTFFDAFKSNSIVVFKVSGVIDLDENDTRYDRENIIVLGQTAPKGGITIAGQGMRWDNCKNITFRYIRFRTQRGSFNDPSGIDCIDNLSVSNTIFDHCSFAYGGDETLSFRDRSHSVTVQNCMFSFGKTGMLLGDSNDYNKSYDLSLIGNAFVQISHRFPNPNSNGRVDIIGNYVYNWHNRLMRTGGSVQLNEIGNYYDSSPNKRGGYHKLAIAGSNNPKVYSVNNRLNANSTITSDGDNYDILYQQWKTQGEPGAANKASGMHALLNYTDPLPNGDDTYTKVVTNKDVGANAYLDNNGNKVQESDALDEAAFNHIINRTFFDWSTALEWKELPDRDWLTNTTRKVVLNTHDQSTHTGVVPNTWITNKGLDPDTFNPLGNDLHENYPNILIYSFQVDQ